MRHPRPTAEYDPEKGWFFRPPPEGYDMLPENNLACPLGRTLTDILAERLSIAASRLINLFHPFITRLTNDQNRDALNQCIADGILTPEVAHAIAEFLGVSLEENP